eukprot:TRINITY_DN28687_c0_g1_i1.p1 TRINITY_DN28687_c0_g1~~TRINITY_DN28687_c0_g1_i1.p1  ORF type:complete len:419 (+),score=76.12 TRINITY_DN28687_c0_g1_i1:29-1258(+)
MEYAALTMPPHRVSRPATGTACRGRLATPEELTKEGLERSMESVASEIKPWEPRKFDWVKKLEDASRNHGRVDLMTSLEHGGMSVAVKVMPNSWIHHGPHEFFERHPKETEQPWTDLGLLWELKKQGFSASCDLLGVFRDDANTYAVMSYAAGGDLFAWCCRERSGGAAAREAEMLPLVVQIFSAVDFMHTMGVAHRDISLENLLLTGPGGDSCDQQVKIIDFGMAITGRTCIAPCYPGPGKPSYQAPEIHSRCEYDAFLADAFSLGVVVYAMAVGNYPWLSTRPGRSHVFDWMVCHGVRALLSKQSAVKKLSASLTELLAGLLEVKPTSRLSVCRQSLQDGAAASQDGCVCVWDAEWLAHGDKQGHIRTPSNCSVSTMAPEQESDGEEEKACVPDQKAAQSKGLCLPS